MRILGHGRTSHLRPIQQNELARIEGAPLFRLWAIEHVAVGRALADHLLLRQGGYQFRFRFGQRAVEFGDEGVLGDLLAIVSVSAHYHVRAQNLCTAALDDHLHGRRVDLHGARASANIQADVQQRGLGIVGKRIADQRLAWPGLFFAENRNRLVAKDDNRQLLTERHGVAAVAGVEHGCFKGVQVGVTGDRVRDTLGDTRVFVSRIDVGQVRQVLHTTDTTFRANTVTGVSVEMDPVAQARIIRLGDTGPLGTLVAGAVARAKQLGALLVGVVLAADTDRGDRPLLARVEGSLGRNDPDVLHHGVTLGTLFHAQRRDLAVDLAAPPIAGHR